MYLSLSIYIYICMYVCMYVRTYVCMYACMHACMHACMYVCMYVCVYVCMCVCIYIYIYTYIFFHHHDTGVRPEAPGLQDELLPQQRVVLDAAAARDEQHRELAFFSFQGCSSAHCETTISLFQGKLVKCCATLPSMFSETHFHQALRGAVLERTGSAIRTPESQPRRFWHPIRVQSFHPHRLSVRIGQSLGCWARRLGSTCDRSRGNHVSSFSISL